MFERYEQLLPTRLYTIHKTPVSDSSDLACRLCGTAPEGMAWHACPALAETKCLARHDAILKILFFEIIFDLGLIDTVPSGIHLSSHSQSTKQQRYRRIGMYRYIESTKSSEQIE